MDMRKVISRTLACAACALVVSCADAGPVEPTDAQLERPTFNGIGWVGGGGRSDSTSTSTTSEGIGVFGGGGRSDTTTTSTSEGGIGWVGGGGR